jgi:hypothetical protein
MAASIWHQRRVKARPITWADGVLNYGIQPMMSATRVE